MGGIIPFSDEETEAQKGDRVQDACVLRAEDVQRQGPAVSGTPSALATGNTGAPVGSDAQGRPACPSTAGTALVPRAHIPPWAGTHSASHTLLPQLQQAGEQPNLTQSWTAFSQPCDLGQVLKILCASVSTSV